MNMRKHNLTNKNDKWLKNIPKLKLIHKNSSNQENNPNYFPTEIKTNKKSDESVDSDKLIKKNNNKNKNNFFYEYSNTNDSGMISDKSKDLSKNENKVINNSEYFQDINKIKYTKNEEIKNKNKDNKQYDVENKLKLYQENIINSFSKDIIPNNFNKNNEGMQNDNKIENSIIKNENKYNKNFSIAKNEKLQLLNKYSEKLNLEWFPIFERNGIVYFRNRVSGDTSFNFPKFFNKKINKYENLL